MNKEQFIIEVCKLLYSVHPAPDLAPLIRIAKLGQRIAQRYVSGQAGEGMDKDAQLLLDLMGDLPDELRGLL